jgi:hypothetical protein
MLAGLCGVVMLLSGTLRGTAGAAEWSAEPSMSVKGEYNSNLLLFDGDNEVVGYWFSPAVRVKGATESLEVDGTVKSDFVQYYGSQDRSLTNLYAPLRTSYRWDRYTFGFEGGFTRDNTLMAELQQTGVVLSFTQRNLWTANPTWSVGLTERLSWQLGYQFADAQYENGLRLGLVNYRVQGGNTALSYQATEQDQLQLTGEYVVFNAPQMRQRWKYYGIGVFLSHSFTDSLTGTVSGGSRFVSSTQDIPGGSLTDRERVWAFGAQLKKVFEQATMLVEARREINPSGFGFLLQTDRLGAIVSHNLSETVTMTLEGAIYRTNAIGLAAVTARFPELQFASITPAISWKFAQWWSLDLSYRYAERTVRAYDQYNFANSTFVMLTYSGSKWAVSR